MAVGATAATIFGSDMALAQSGPVDPKRAVIQRAIADFNQRKGAALWRGVMFFLHRNSVGVRIELLGLQHFADVSFAQVSVKPAAAGQLVYYSGTRYLMFKFGPADKIASVELLNG